MFAVPGSIYSEGSRGCHYLLRDGAVLVEELADIVHELGGLETAEAPPTQEEEHTAELTDTEQAVLAAVGYELTLLEELTAMLDVPVAELLAVLTVLEMKGKLEQRAGGYRRS